MISPKESPKPRWRLRRAALVVVTALAAAQVPDYQRGAYLVNGLGHCAACHTPRNSLGAEQQGQALAGGLIPVQNWLAPALTDAARPACSAGRRPMWWPCSRQAWPRRLPSSAPWPRWCSAVRSI